MDIVGRYAERVLAFYAGRIIADGKPAAALSNERGSALRHRRSRVSLLQIEALRVKLAVGRGAARHQSCARARRDGRAAGPQWRRQDDDLCAR